MTPATDQTAAASRGRSLPLARRGPGVTTDVTTSTVRRIPFPLRRLTNSLQPLGQRFACGTIPVASRWTGRSAWLSHTCLSLNGPLAVIDRASGPGRLESGQARLRRRRIYTAPWAPAAAASISTSLVKQPWPIGGASRGGLGTPGLPRF
jgi:hypothetical protein